MPDFIIENLVKEYPTPTDPLRILAGVNLTLDRGDNLAIVGESGSGKSTLLQIAGTLDQPTSGSVELLGTKLDQLDPVAVAEFRNRHLGFIFQDHHLLPQLTALENVLLPVVAQGPSTESQEARARLLLEQVGLAERVEHRPAELSGGERQRVAVARALINEPVLILADEPTGSLDPESADRVGQLLLDLPRDQDTILICVTHSQALASIFGKQMRLTHGQLNPV